MQPSLLLPHAHQSGVNCAYATVLDSTTCLVATGGDDQAIHIAACQCLEQEQQLSRVICLRRWHLAEAHHSALKGIWTDGNVIFSAGLDQRLCRWQLPFSLKEQVAAAANITYAGISTEDQEQASSLVDISILPLRDASSSVHVVHFQVVDVASLHVTRMDGTNDMDKLGTSHTITTTINRSNIDASCSGSYNVLLSGRGMQLLESC